ncbi:hypothetical protein DV515_00012624 [Chloebia gouldiae]|uniref:MARVEL domain-containing protein n=1 Tax=Chloebia gouldiae TaxID=44316 RepID=A0A3L8S377_CHLGU|nr:hypothetical protein DV515_00012624 [Chloebia gouldiae]
MEDPEAAGAAPAPGLSSLLPSRELLRSRKGQLLLAESRDREQPDVRLAFRRKAFTLEVRLTSVVGKALGWVAAGRGLYELHQKNASYPIPPPVSSDLTFVTETPAARCKLSFEEAPVFFARPVGRRPLLQPVVEEAGISPPRQVLSFIIFICYIASLAASFMMAPLLEFLLALFLFFAYASKLNEKFKGVHWPLADFLRCVTAAIIYFAISIAAVSKYNDGASKAAGMGAVVKESIILPFQVFGFAATIVFAVDFYITFNDLVTFLKQGSSDSPEGRKTEGGLLQIRQIHLEKDKKEMRTPTLTQTEEPNTNQA